MAPIGRAHGGRAERGRKGRASTASLWLAERAGRMLLAVLDCRAEGEVKEVQDAIPPLAAIKEGIRLDIQKQILEKNKAAEMADGLKKEVDAVKEELTKVRVCMSYAKRACVGVSACPVRNGQRRCALPVSTLTLHPGIALPSSAVCGIGCLRLGAATYPRSQHGPKLQCSRLEGLGRRTRQKDQVEGVGSRVSVASMPARRARWHRETSRMR